MKRIALIAALSVVALPAFAQSGTFTPYGGSIYGGPPQGYVYQAGPQPNLPVPHQYEQPPRSNSTVCTTYGRQTFCN